MSKYFTIIPAVAVLTFILQNTAHAQPANGPTEMKPPIAKKAPKVLKIHVY